MSRVLDRIRRIGRFTKAILRHPRVPRWLKYGLGVLLLIPGPVDELLAGVVLVGLAVWKWDIVCECWTVSALQTQTDERNLESPSERNRP